MRIRIQHIIISVLIIGSFWNCTPDLSGDQLAKEPGQEEDVQMLLSYLNSRERTNEDNPSFYFHRANALMESGNVPNALRDIEKAIRLNPKQASYYDLKSQLLMERKSYTRALSAALKAQQLGSRGPRTYVAMARAWSSLENYSKALESIETAIALLPLDFDLYYLKSEILKQKGDEKEAEEALLESLKINPAYLPAVFDLIRINTQRGDFDASYNLLEGVMTVEGMEQEARWALSDLLYNQNKLDSAALILNQLKADLEYRQRAYKVLGNIKYRKYQYDSVFYFTRKMLDADSTNIDALVLNARAYDRKQFYQRSMEEYSKALAIDSTRQNVQDELAKLKRKVAYLRNLEKERSEAPLVVPLKRKEITN